MKGSQQSSGRRGGRWPWRGIRWLAGRLSRRRRAVVANPRTWCALVTDAEHRAAEDFGRAVRSQDIATRQLDIAIQLRVLLREMRELATAWAAVGPPELATAAGAATENLRTAWKRIVELEGAAVDAARLAVADTGRSLSPHRAYAVRARAERWQTLADLELDLALRLHGLVVEQHGLTSQWAEERHDVAESACAVEASLRAAWSQLLRHELAVISGVADSIRAARFPGTDRQ